MFDAPESLFFDRGDELPVAQQRRRHIAVIRVKAEDEHLSARIQCALRPQALKVLKDLTRSTHSLSPASAPHEAALRNAFR